MWKLLQSETDNLHEIGLLERQIEAMLFVSPQPVTTQELASHLGISPSRAEESIFKIKQEINFNQIFPLWELSDIINLP